jgi:acyl dehydratase
MSMRVITSAADIKALEGQEVGVSDWILVDQARINHFADATEDHQWIHVNEERARAELPTGSTIAHGYLLVSLLPRLLDTFVTFTNVTRVINYGLNEVRFKNMVPAGKRVRMRSKLISARQRAGGVQVILDNTIEIEGETKPACTMETIVLYFFSNS